MEEIIKGRFSKPQEDSITLPLESKFQKTGSTESGIRVSSFNVGTECATKIP